MAAPGEDRPIVVSGGDQMYTVTLPPDTLPEGGAFIVNAIPEDGPFKTIEVFNAVTKEVVYKGTATGNWTVTIQ
jgi:hypothetical protein